MLSRRDLLQLTLGAPLISAASRLATAPALQAGPGPAGLGREELDALEALVRQFRATDAAHGGGLVRKAVIGQLNTVAEVLSDGPGKASARLYRIAADLAGLAGWMSHDTGRFASAQRYWAFGITAAKQAGEGGQAAELISRMAHQMVYLGHPNHALNLLDVADRAADAGASHRLHAMLTAQRGRMLAAAGDSRQSLHLLDTARQHLDQAETSGEPIPDWIAYFTPAELAGATAVSHRDLHTLHGKTHGPASTHFAHAIRLRGPGYDRCRAMDLVGQAAALLTEGEPEQACVVADNALDLATSLNSTLVHSRILTLTTAAAPYSHHHPHLTALRERAHALTQGTAIAG